MFKMIALVFLAVFGIVLETSYAEPVVLKCNSMDCKFNFKVVQTFSMWTINRPIDQRTRVYFSNNQMFYAGAPPNSSLPREKKPGRLVLPEEENIIIRMDGVYKLVTAFQNMDDPNAYPTVPGPTIDVPKGARVRVRIYNSMFSESTSIHWHGMHMRGTPFMDGVQMISQCPILPRQSFEYDFIADPSGTHWYHSHTGPQREDGLFGALIVRDPTVQTEVTQGDFVFHAMDWHHITGVEGQTDGIPYPNGPQSSPYIGFNGLGVHFFPLGPFSGFDSAPINGIGRVYDAYGNHNGVPLEVFNVQSSSKYRFRVVGAQNIWSMRISIDLHRLRIVATDGYEVAPHTVDALTVEGGERYDFIIDANQPVGNYWIRMEVNSNAWSAFDLPWCNDTLLNKNHNQGFYQGCPYQKGNKAILRYQGAQLVEPVTESIKCTPLSRCKFFNCPFKSYPLFWYTDCTHVTELRPLASDPPPDVGTNVLRTVNLNMGVAPELSINNKAFALPAAPLQTQPLSEAIPSEFQCRDYCNYTSDPGCTCTQYEQVPLNSVVDLLIGAVGNREINVRGHPFHVHGYSFWVMDVFFPNQTVQNTTAWLDRSLLNLNPDTGVVVCNRDSPRCADIRWGPAGTPPVTNAAWKIRKDSVFVPSGGWVWARLRADNAGWWFTHCHQGLHSIAGMAAALYVGTDSQQPAIPANFPQCHSFSSSQSVGSTVATTTSGARPSNVGLSVMSLALLLAAWKIAQ